MTKRILDILVSTIVLLLASPLLVLSATGVALSSSGPILYRARRVGRNGIPFEMLKFRTMHLNDGSVVITSRADPRVFGFGRVLRRLKIDELPQFVNVLRGEMSVVGPRPEDPKIVTTAYTDWMRETLRVRPGITSPGAIFYYARGEALIDADAPEQSYVETLLPAKLAVERAYLDRATVLSDMVCILHTAAAILGEAIGRPVPPIAADLAAASAWAPASVREHVR